MTNHALQKQNKTKKQAWLEVKYATLQSCPKKEEKKQNGVKYIVLVQEAKRIMGEYKCIWLTKKIKSICTCAKSHQVSYSIPLREYNTWNYVQDIVSNYVHIITSYVFWH